MNSEALKGIRICDFTGQLAGAGATNWLASFGIPLRVQQRILKYHDERTVDVLKNNPYALLGFGMSFGDIDVIAEQLGFEKSAPVRLAAALESAMRKRVEKGHTYATHQVLRPEVIKLLGEKDLVAEVFSNGYFNGYANR